jgi:hypothetical protein
MSSGGSVIEVEAVDLAVRDRLLSDPARMEKIFKHLSAGGTLVDYCKLVGQPYAELMAWISADEGRMAKYEAGKRARQDWLFEQVLRQYKALSELDIRELYDESGSLKNMADWPESAALAVAGVESLEQTQTVDGSVEVVGVVKKVKTYDKNKSLEALGKYLRMFADVLEVRGEISIKGALEEAEARMQAARPVQDAEIVGESGGEIGTESGGEIGTDEPI